MKKTSSPLTISTNASRGPEKKRHKICPSCFNKCIEWKLII